MTLPRFPESEYRIPFFSESGFVRRKCPKCEEYFWTQNPDRFICGESPCEDYTFINNSPIRRPYDVRDMREAFLSFFEKRGHERISPYPVVARWRDDLYFTSASVVDFQPYVTNGIIPPPANPLVISQPCIRLVDVDNVGLTFGRHLTIFEMGGAHAFNYPDKEVYWKDGTVRYHHEFVTRDLGVKSEEVVYKEGIWQGGGNAGPDVECIIRGQEVATLVFMYYKVEDDKFIELPIRTVDTGYGIERYTWLSQGTMSCFHAVYGPILAKVLGMAGLKLDERLLLEYAKYTGGMRIEKMSDVKKLQAEIAEKLGIDLEELRDMLSPLENVFAVVDHTKTLAFMLAEGIVPSNVREGYLTRLVLRRTYRLLRSLGLEDKLSDIVGMQIDYWSPDFPLLKGMRDEIMDILLSEEGKYKRTLGRGSDLVRKIAIDLKAKGRKELPLEKLIELYDSQGIPPDIVSEYSKKEEIAVSVPDDFYSRIASRHVSAPPTKPTPLQETLAEKVAPFPPTKTLFYENPYLNRFEANVLGILDDRYVILDATAFYPEGGGQPPDLGILAWNGNETKVVNVQRIDNVIVHEIEGKAPEVGSRVEGIIDWDRRSALMRHHTSTHILIGALRRVLGEHAWQAGAQKDVDETRLDVSHHRRIAREELEKIEELANSVVMKNIPVEVSFMPRGEAESRYGFRLYQGGVVPGKEIRVVKIGDWDIEACGGTHCSSTGEVGLIKISRVDRIQDGVERVFFSAGMPAVKLIREREKMILKLAEMVKAKDVVRGVERLMEERERAEKERERMKKRLLEYEADIMLGKVKRLAKVNFLAESMKEVSPDYLIELSARLVKSDPNLIVFFFSVNETAQLVAMAGSEAVKLGVDVSEIVARVAKVIGGGGGGEKDFGQGGGPLVERVPLAMKDAEKAVRELFRLS